MMVWVIPAGKSLAISATARRMFWPVVSAFEPGRWNTATAIAGSRFRYEIEE